VQCVSRLEPRNELRSTECEDSPALHFRGQRQFWALDSGNRFRLKTEWMHNQGEMTTHGLTNKDLMNSVSEGSGRLAKPYSVGYPLEVWSASLRD
jgi:hypothetical protein